MTSSPTGIRDGRTLLLALYLIGIGVGWLLTSLGIVTGINWVWTIGLTAAGLLPFVLYGVDKLSVVVGPFFMVAGLLSVLRQTDRLSINHEMPILVILAGVLLLVARSPTIPLPAWAITPTKIDS